jgi:hypothetical protein
VLAKELVVDLQALVRVRHEVVDQHDQADAG